MSGEISAVTREKIGDGREWDGPLDATIHWCLVFDQPLSQVVIEDETPCALHGLILWQNLNMFLAENQEAHGKEVKLTELNGKNTSLIEKGISSTIGELRNGKVNARLTLEFSPANESRNILRNICWQDIAEVPLKPLLTAIKKKIMAKNPPDANIVSLAGLLKSSGYLGERSFKYKVALAAARGVPLKEIPLKHVYTHLACEIVDKKEYIRRGSSAKVSLYNSLGEIVDSLAVPIN